MRTLRLMLYFVVGMLLGALAVVANAETIPATLGPATVQPSWGYQMYGPNGLSSCAAVAAALSNASGTVTCEQCEGTTLKGVCRARVTYTDGTGYLLPYNIVEGCPSSMTPNYNTGLCEGSGTSYSCPTGQNWTLDGQTCTRPDCVEPETRNAVGVCQVPTCTVAANQRVGTSRYQFPFPQPSGVTWCIQGCQVYPDDTGKNIVDGTMYAYGLVNGAGGSASTCVSSGNNVIPASASPIGTSTSPPCTKQQGSISDSSGKVVCVDPTTPGATAPPVQSSSSKTTSYGDGSSTTVTTTNTCTGDGACSSTTTTTITGVGGGGTPGQAGTPGTSTTNSDDPSAEKSEFCAKNPNLQMCKGGMNEEATQKQIAKLLNGMANPASEGYDRITAAGQFKADDANLKTEDDKRTTAATGGFDPTTGSKSSWQAAIESGWLTPVPSSGCTPINSTIAGRTWNFDICPTAARISEIGGYAAWFMLMVGGFVMVTGGRREA